MINGSDQNYSVEYERFAITLFWKLLVHDFLEQMEHQSN